MTGEYTFGDSDVAIERLGLVAAVFDGPSRALLADAVPPGVDLALDLGCGPGHTTRLVASVCRPHRSVGLDASPRSIDAARALEAADPLDGVVDFAVHDVTATPLPEAPADLIYVRLLLAHLPDPVGLVERWRTQLTPTGRLVIDEIETMETPPGVLSDYEDLVVALVASEGGVMYAGPLLAPLGSVVEIDVDAALAARMYAMNLAVWGPEAIRRGLATAPEISRLADGLATTPGRTPVHWTLRQLVLPP